MRNNQWKKKSSGHLYKKLRLSYSAVIITVVGLLVGFSIHAGRQRALETNRDYARKLCEETAAHIQDLEADAEYLHRLLYMGSEELEDILCYLQLDTETYLEKHLDAYTWSGYIDNKDLYSYVENAYSAYPGMKRMELVSYSSNRSTIFYSDNAVRVKDNAAKRKREIIDEGLARQGEISFLKEIRDPGDMNIKGGIVFTFDTSYLEKLQEKYPMARLYLFAKNETPLFSGEGDRKLEEFQQTEAEKKLKSYLLLQEAEDFMVVTALDKKSAEAIPLPDVLAILGVGFFLAALGEFFINLYLKRLTSRVNGILQGMEQVKTGNLKVELAANDKGDELDMISVHFNQMCRDLESYIRKSYLSEIEQKNAQMLALQSQINPHFLYNTLEAIRMKAICNGDREVGKMLYSLAVTFRSQLKEADVITLMQEMHYCKKYLELFEYRYQNKFTAKVECDPGLGETPVIKFILQPIIENYFIHGIRMEDEGNFIHIYAREEDGELYIHVTDNGYGMDPESMEEKNRELEQDEMDVHRSIGVTNVNRRLKAAYGKEYGVTLAANEPRGLHVIIKVKIEEGGIEEKCEK
ncbi:MAG: sensor histidine kinase [Clostridiales bacterium]|nr:sensor histidine kinase [Clostridiales bacterium]